MQILYLTCLERGGPPELNDEDFAGGLWRLTAISRQDPKNKANVFDDYCMTDADALMYNGFSVEEFYITNSAMIYISGLRTQLWHYEDGDGVKKRLHMESGMGDSAAQMPFTFGH